MFSRRKPKSNRIKSHGNCKEEQKINTNQFDKEIKYVLVVACARDSTWRRTRCQDTALEDFISLITTCHHLGEKEVRRGFTVFRLSKEINIRKEAHLRFLGKKDITQNRGNKLVVSTLELDSKSQLD